MQNSTQHSPKKLETSYHSSRAKRQGKAAALERLRALKEEKLWREDKRRCEESLAEFTKRAWEEVVEPGTPLVWNWHLDTICGYLEALGERKIKRLIINVPPGSMKSILVNVMYPAWCWIKHPTRRYLCGANEDGLATRDALKMQGLVWSDWYQERWKIEQDPQQREKTMFANAKKGHRQSIGIQARVTGKRGDEVLIDDPHDAKRAFSDTERVSIVQSFDQAWSNRINDPKRSAFCLIMQRLHQQDLSGHLLRKIKTQWVILSIPMEYEGKPTFDAGKDIGRPELNDPRKKMGELMFPARMDKEFIDAEKEDKGEYGWAGQYQQRPVPLGGGILKAHWWKRWPKDKPIPAMEHIFYSWDTAFTEEDRKNGAYSAFLKWGIFWDEIENRFALMLLKRWHGQVDYPDLRAMAKKEEKEGQPHAHLIEKKASGQSLIQDLRRSGVKVRTVIPRGDKTERAYIESSLLKAGVVCAPERKWADEVIDLIAKFPNGAPPSADYTDVFTQTVQYLRKGWWLQHPDDEEPPPSKTERNEDEYFDDIRKPKARAYGAGA